MPPFTHHSRLLGIAAILISVVGTLAGCAGLDRGPDAPATPERAASEIQDGANACSPRFPDAKGWYGGDAAYSVPLPRSTDSEGSLQSVWLFGDSFVERRNQPGRRAYPYVHNSIGISRCEANGHWSIDIFWRSQEEANASAFFQPNPESAWVAEILERTGQAPYYWPMDGFVLDGKLFIGLLRVAHSEPRGPFSLPFRLVGTDLARIDNPNASPMDWQIRILTMSEDESFFPGTAFAVQGEYVYAFAFFDRNDGHAPRGLIRIPVEAMLHSTVALPRVIETFVDRASWQPGLLPKHAATLIPTDATEMSIHWNPARGRWIAVESTPSQAGTDASQRGIIRIHEADTLVGPWSEGTPLFRMPELKPSDDDTTDPNIFCYAAKAHAQYSPPDELVISYVCNLFARSPEEGLVVLEELTHRPDLYRPRVVRVPVPFFESEAWPGAEKEGRRADQPLQ